PAGGARRPRCRPPARCGRLHRAARGARRGRRGRLMAASRWGPIAPGGCVVLGPGVHCTLTAAAVALLARSSDGAVLPALWRLLEAHGRATAPTDHEVGPHRLRVVAGADRSLVIGVIGIDFAEAA